MHTGALRGVWTPTGQAVAVETMTAVVVHGYGGRRDVGAQHTQAGPGALLGTGAGAIYRASESAT